MVKKISFLILSVAILVIGVIAFSKLSYWDRSVRVFSFSSDTNFEGRAGRGPGGREFEGRGGSGRREGFNRQERPGEGFAGPGMREVPDSIKGQDSKQGKVVLVRE